MSDPAPAKKLQHFVPQFYLRRWSTQEKIFCLQGGKVFQTGTRNLGAENYFYALRSLTNEDITYLRDFIAQSTAGIRPIHEKLLELAVLMLHTQHKASEELHNDDPQKLRLDQALNEMFDDLHTGVENHFQPMLKELIEGRLSFLEEASSSALFFQAIATQYVRTNPYRRFQASLHPVIYAQLERVSPILIHMIGANVGFSLFASRESLEIHVLDNHTSLPFVATDQPLINLAANPVNTDIPSRFELYYPLSPRKALIILEPGSDTSLIKRPLDKSTVDMLNLRMSAEANKQIYANEKPILEDIAKVLSAYKASYLGHDSR